MYCSCQPITTCSDQSEQKFSNVPSLLFVLDLLLNAEAVSFLYYFFIINSILASLVWSNLTVWLDELGKCSRTKRECDSSQKAALLLCRSFLSFW